MSEDPASALAESVRRLIDATIRTLADDATITSARRQIDSLTTQLTVDAIPDSFGVQHRGGMSPVAGNAVIGTRNAIAPPLTIHHHDDGGVWTDLTLG
ncbi:MAG TPA: PaaI family thioesterase, partial [Mycobacterium sp.]